MMERMKTPKNCSTPAELVHWIQPGHRIFIQGAMATANDVLAALAEQHQRLMGCEIIHLHTHGPASYTKCPEFRVVNLFVGENMRPFMDNDRIDYLPCFLSEIPSLFRNRIRPLDVAIIQVSPPDEHGFCSLGTSVDVSKAALEGARIVLAHMNPRMPRTFGDALVSVEQITACWTADRPLWVAKASGTTSDIDQKIATHVASLVDDGACLQMGIGAVPDLVLKRLIDRKNLGVHTEMFSDGLIQLVESGVVDNSRKKVHRGLTVTSFVNGSERLLSFVHNNPSLLFLESSFVNRAEVIAQNDQVVAINSAVEIDLTGQVVSDSIGTHVISGVGGQMDFVRGATLSKNGKAIVALPSRTKKGLPRIVNLLQPGAGVVTTRAHVHFIVTEFGVADLYGKTLGERAKALIAISHPEDRERLTFEWRQR